MKGYYCLKSEILVWLVVFFVTCGLACREKPPEETDVNKPEPTPGKVEVKPDVNAVEPKAPPETTAEGHRRHKRTARINQQELVEDIDKALLLDKPSKLTDKRIP